MRTLPELESLPAAELLQWALAEYGDRFAIATSFQKEGMVLVDIAATISSRVRVFTLDTGRLPAETHGMIDTVRNRYGIAVEVVMPDPAEVEQMVSLHGTNLFYQSVDLRHRCCEVRKVRPLERKLTGLSAWASGLRRSQDGSRAQVKKVEDEGPRIKLNPLAGWTAAEVEAYLTAHEVPRHPLYERGYTSIGCAPCTRAVASGESERAGRWWWEESDHKECGIHFAPDGTVRRAATSAAEGKNA